MKLRILDRIMGKVIHALESGHLSNLNALYIPFSQFFLSPHNVLCCRGQRGDGYKGLFAIAEVFILVVLRIVYDHSTAGHPGRSKTVATVRCAYYWLWMRVESLCCALRPLRYDDDHNKTGVMSGPASMLGCPPPERPQDVFAVQLTKSRQG